MNTTLYTESLGCPVSHKNCHLMANKIMTFVLIFIVKPGNCYIFSLFWLSLLLYDIHFYITARLRCVINYSHINEADNRE